MINNYPLTIPAAANTNETEHNHHACSLPKCIKYHQAFRAAAATNLLLELLKPFHLLLGGEGHSVHPLKRVVGDLVEEELFPSAQRGQPDQLAAGEKKCWADTASTFCGI